MGTTKTRPSRKERGVLFFIVWFVIGGLIGLITCGLLAFGELGGYGTPPRFVMFLRSSCPYVLLPVLSLGGLPASLRIAHGRPWGKAAVAGFAVCGAMWILFFGLEYFGFWRLLGFRY